MGVGAELEEIERVSLVRSVSWELVGETIDTTERNMYTHDYSRELRRNKATADDGPCFVTVLRIVASRTETRSSKLDTPSQGTRISLASINTNQPSSEAQTGSTYQWSLKL